jgi:hypothetical protein
MDTDVEVDGRGWALATSRFTAKKRRGIGEKEEEYGGGLWVRSRVGRPGSLGL